VTGRRKVHAWGDLRPYGDSVADSEPESKDMRGRKVSTGEVTLDKRLLVLCILRRPNLARS